MKAGRRRRAARTGPGGERLGLGERLVAARRRRGLSQLEAAREIGVSRETVARIEVDHIPSDWTRAKVLLWLADQESPAVRQAAAAARAGPRKVARLARARERRAAAQRIGAERRRRLARLAVRRRATRAINAALPAAEDGKRRR